MIKQLFKALGTLVLVAGGYHAEAQLAGGTYTINSGAATGGTNYASFTAAVSAMSSGITGPVVFNVTPGSGPYTGPVTIGAITGASATNTIRFNGNGATIQFTPTSTYSGALMLNGAKYVKMDSLTFLSQSTTYGYGAILYNGCDYDSITRCTFDLTGVSTTASANSMGIRISSTASGTSSTTSGATNTFLGNNQVLGPTGAGGPYYGFYFYGPNTNNVYYNNKISNFYYYGVYDYYGSNISYLGNELTRQTRSTVAGGYYGFQLYYMTSGSRVIGNKVMYLGGPSAGSSYTYPFNVFNATGTAASPILVANNVIGNMTSSPYYGIRLSGSDYVRLYHNTISIDEAVSYTNANYGIYVTSSDYADVKNNVVSITGGGTSTKYGLYYTSATGISSDYNDVYVNSSQSGTQSFGYNGAGAATLSAFQTANPGLEANSIDVNPQFAAAGTGNFRPTNNALVGAGANLNTSVPKDINGLPRASSPTIGAYEVLPTITNNASLAALVAPTAHFCAGSQPVKVSVRNAGTNNITSLQVNWSLNGVTQTPVSYTGTLVPVTASSGNTSADVTLGTANLVAGNNTLKIWTAQPNNVVDGDLTNDTLTTTLTTTTFAVTSSIDTVCSSSPFTLELSPSTGYAAGALEWQSSTNGATWTPLANTDSAYYTGSNLSGNTQYRAHILNSSAGCYSPAVTVYVSNPMVVSTTAASRCGIGTVTLQATPSAGAKLSWYASATGGTALDTGNSFTTPSILATRNFYVAATVGGKQFTGKPTPLTTNGNSGFSDIGLMFDATSPFVLRSVDVYPYSTSSTSGSVTIALKNSAGTVLASTTATVVVSASGALNTVPLNFNVPAGTNHRLVVTAASGMSTLFRESSTANFSYPYTIPGVVSITSAYTSGASSAYYYYFYNWQVVTGCEGARVAVAATVTPAPAINATAGSNSICNGTSTTLTVSSTNTNYTYSWSSGSTANSFSVSPTATTRYIVNAVDPATNCAAADTVSVTVLNQTAAITPSAAQTICTGSTTTLSATTGSNLTYQWYIGGAPVNGATSATYAAGAAGTYTVKVSNTSTGCNKTSNGVVINTAAPPVASINRSGAITLCSGDTLTLQGQSGTGYTYQWKRGSANAPGASTATTYQTTTAGVYTLVVSANGCSATSAPATVTIGTRPVPWISPAATTVSCDSIQFTSATPNVTYAWQYNGIPVVGGSGASYTARASGSYSVLVTSNANGCTAQSPAVVATIHPTPAGQITYSSPISFCEGGAVVLNTYTSANIAYQWTKNGTPIAGATTPSLIVDSAGSYSVRVSNTATGCGSVAAPVPVTVFPAPVASIAYNPATNLLSTTQAFAQYQGRFNNQPISNATQPTHTPTTNGAYAVSVTDNNGCIALSDVQFVNSVGISQTPLGQSLKIYPNPTSGILRVAAAEKVQLTLQDFAGKMLFRGTSDDVLDLTNYADGMYLLNVTDAQGRLIRAEKVIKSRQ